MQEIQGQLAYIKLREEQLLEQLRHLRLKATPLADELSKSVAGEIGSIAARELLGLPSLGRRIGRAVVRQQQKQNLVYVENQIGAGHQQHVSQAVGLLKNAAQKGAITPAQKGALISLLTRAQGFAKLETRIARTIVALQNIESRRIVPSSDIERRAPRRVLPSQPKFPRLASIRNRIPEVEPALRKFVRSKLSGAFGEDWGSRLQSKFPNDFERWSQRARQRRGRDSLDGQTFGELVHTIESFSELKESIASKSGFRLAVSILNRSRPLFIHPLEAQSEDVDEREFRKISLAIESIMSELSQNNS